MSNMKNKLLLILIVVVLAGCSLTEELTFRSDFSGEGVFRYQLVMEPGADRDSLIRSHTELVEEIRLAALEVEGISSVRYAIDRRTRNVELHFAFSGTEALNALYALEMFQELPFLRKEFSHWRSRLLTIEWPVHGLTHEDRLAMDSDPEDMLGTNQYNLIVNLPSEILSKSVEMGENTVESSSRGFSTSGTWKSFYTHTEPMKYRVWLRR